jgi:hypothetical protein
VSDVLIVTLGLLVGVIALLARPCAPADLRRVKASRLALEPLPESAPEPLLATDPAPLSEPGFADGLTAPA